MKNNNKNASKTHKKCQETKYIFCKDSRGHAQKGLTNGIKRVRKAPQKCVEWVKKTLKKQQKYNKKTAKTRQKT